MSEQRTFRPTKGAEGPHREEKTQECLRVGCSGEVPMYVSKVTGGVCLGCRTA